MRLLALALLLPASVDAAGGVRIRTNARIGAAASPIVGVNLGAASPVIPSPSGNVLPHGLEASVRPTIPDGVIPSAASFPLPGAPRAAAPATPAAPAPAAPAPSAAPDSPLPAPIERAGNAPALRHFDRPAAQRTDAGDRRALGVLYNGERRTLPSGEQVTAEHGAVLSGAGAVWRSAMGEASAARGPVAQAAAFAAASDRLLAPLSPAERLSYYEHAAMAAAYETDFPVPAAMRPALGAVSGYGLDRLAALGTPEALALVALQSADHARARHLFDAAPRAMRVRALALARARLLSDPGFAGSQARLSRGLDVLAASL